MVWGGGGDVPNRASVSYYGLAQEDFRLERANPRRGGAMSS